jgi:hypothetical protein
VSRLADDKEAAQLVEGVEVLQESRKVLGDPMAPHGELRYAVLRLAESLGDVLRVAESRGMRLAPDADNGEADHTPTAEAFA